MTHATDLFDAILAGGLDPLAQHRLSPAEQARSRAALAAAIEQRNAEHRAAVAAAPVVQSPRYTDPSSALAFSSYCSDGNPIVPLRQPRGRRP